MARKPFEIYSTLVSSRHLRNLFAQRHGIKAEVVRDWGRPQESDEFPTGTGKANTLDRLLGDIRQAYPIFPVEAREIGSVVREEINRLDMENGALSVSNESNPCLLAIKSMQEHLDVLHQLEKLEPDDTGRLETEWLEFESAYFQLKGCVDSILDREKRKQNSIKNPEK